MFSFNLCNHSFFIFLNKKILFSQKVFYLKKSSMFVIRNNKHTWFIKLQKDLYHFGLIIPFNK